MATKKLEFFYDLSSPYSYLASTQVEAIAERTGAEIVYRPFVLGALFKAVGNDMPAKVPHKARYMLADLARWAEHYGVPFRMTTQFPVNAMRAHRMIVWAERDRKDGALTHALYHALWVDDADITDDKVLRPIAERVGLDADRALAANDDPEVKARLRAYTDEAAARGVFGAPALFVGDQLFWGNDRLHFVEAALRK